MHDAPRATLPDPSLLMRLALAYRGSSVLFAAAELDVFTRLADGPRDAGELARDLGADPEALRLLLEACVAEGLLRHDGAAFRNADVTDAYLVQGRIGYIAHGLKFAEDLVPAWTRLAELVRTGRPTMPPESVMGDDPEKTRAFVYAMHERARGMSAVLPYGVDFSGRRRLLDVGGGPGTYSMVLLAQTPGLTATILDRPGVLDVTREIVAAHGYADRIELLPGDYRTASFGEGYDCALLSGMMHRERPEVCRLLLRKSFEALVPGGLVVISDVFFDDDARTSPPFATYFAINMMLMCEDGTAHAHPAMARWLGDAGFERIEVRRLPPPNPHTLVIGVRP